MTLSSAFFWPRCNRPRPDVIGVGRFAGLAEITLGLLLLWRRQRWPLLLAGVLLIGLLLDVALFSPHLLLQAFNPLTTNLAALALCWVAWRAETLQSPPH